MTSVWIVDGDLRVEAGLFRGAVVFGVEFHVGDGRSLEVNVDREFEGVVEVGVLSAVAVIKVALDKAGRFS